MAEWVVVARADDVPEDGALRVTYGDKGIALFRAGEKIYALDDFCPHVGAMLSQGRRDALTITCPQHGVVYSITSGAALSEPHWGPASTFPVRVRDGAVEIDWSKRRYPFPHP